MEREPELMPKCLFSSSSLRKAPSAWDAPGLGLTRIFLWTELHVRGLPPGGKRVGGSSIRAVPRTPLLFHRLKLMSCVCALLPLSLFCLLSSYQAHPALPRNPKAKFASDCRKQSWSCLAHICPQPECLPNHRARM